MYELRLMFERHTAFHPIVVGWPTRKPSGRPLRSKARQRAETLTTMRAANHGEL